MFQAGRGSRDNEAMGSNRALQGEPQNFLPDWGWERRDRDLSEGPCHPVPRGRLPAVTLGGTMGIESLHPANVVRDAYKISEEENWPAGCRSGAPGRVQAG